MTGRTKTYEAIINGRKIPDAGVPESFRVLKHELQALAIDVKMLDENKHEISMMKQELDKAEAKDDGSFTEGVSFEENLAVDEEDIKEGFMDLEDLEVLE